VFNGGIWNAEVERKKALIDPKTNQSVTFGELKSSINAFGASLIADGWKKGDVLCLLAPNYIQYPIALFGAIRAGATVTSEFLV
jgi:acyl-CoA synthetase (AMP-forming)/AMP-acid ligase II